MLTTISNAGSSENISNRKYYFNTTAKKDLLRSSTEDLFQKRPTKHRQTDKVFVTTKIETGNCSLNNKINLDMAI